MPCHLFRLFRGRTRSYLTIIVGFTQLICIRAAAITGAPSYEDMVRAVLGQGWGTVLEVVVLIYQFGACVAYLDVFADQGTSILCECVFEDCLCQRRCWCRCRR